jgi:hypothetical protein
MLVIEQLPPHTNESLTAKPELIVHASVVKLGAPLSYRIWSCGEAGVLWEGMLVRDLLVAFPAAEQDDREAKAGDVAAFLAAG